MIFSFGIGSKGEGHPSYSVRLPFAVAPGRTLKLEDGGRFKLLGKLCEISEEQGQYAMTIVGFDNEETASKFLLKACAGLIWFGLKNSAGFMFDPDLTHVKLFEQPKPFADGSPYASIAKKVGWYEIDGHYDAIQTIVIPDHKKLFVFSAGAVTARVDTPISIFSEIMLEGMADGQPELVLCNPKLRLACEVYLSSHFESSVASSFLSRITTLEILVTNTPAQNSVRNLVGKFMYEANVARKDEKNEVVRQEYESLVSRLAFLRYRSIKSQIRALVEDSLQANSEFADSADVSKEISNFYDLRSNLLHTGQAEKMDIQKANNRLNKIVPLVLTTLFRKTALCD